MQLTINIDTREPLSDRDRTVLLAAAGQGSTTVTVGDVYKTVIAMPDTQDAAVQRAADPTFAPGAVSSPTTRAAEQPWEQPQPQGDAVQVPPAAEPETKPRAKRRTKAQIAADEAAKTAAAAPAAQPSTEGPAIPITIPAGHYHAGDDPAGQPIFHPIPAQPQQPPVQQPAPQEWAATTAPPLQQQAVFQPPQGQAPEQVLLGYSAEGQAIYGTPPAAVAQQQPQNAAVAPPWRS